MIYGYCRISTKKQLDQNGLESQKQLILEKYQDAIIYQEQASGQNNERKIFNQILNEIVEGDILVCTKLDRFCRSTKEGLEYIDILLNRGVSIHILNMGMIDNTPIGKLMITTLLAYAEFEKTLIIERMNEGLEVAKTKPGFKMGRPKKYSKNQLNHAIELLKEYSYSQVQRMTGISESTLLREKIKRNSVAKGDD